MNQRVTPRGVRTPTLARQMVTDRRKDGLITIFFVNDGARFIWIACVGFKNQSSY